MADIVITEFMDRTAIDTLAHEFDVFYDAELFAQPARLQDLLHSTQALIVRNRTQVDRALLQTAPQLRVIGRLGVGLDNIDLAACVGRQIKVHPATGTNALAVAEYVIAAIMLLLRGAWTCSDKVVQGMWPRAQAIGREVSGKTLALIGFGAIAQATAQKACALGMQVFAHDPYLADEAPAWAHATSKPLEELLPCADILSLHVPLTEHTYHLLDESALSLLPAHCVLINTSRGEVVDESALVAALSSGRLAGAALDVFETEPLTEQAGSKFKNLKNVLLTPHIAGVTHESNIRTSAMIAGLVSQELRHDG